MGDKEKQDMMKELFESLRDDKMKAEFKEFMEKQKEEDGGEDE